MGPAAVLSIIVSANTKEATAALARTQGQLKATAATAEASAASSAASWGTAGKSMKKAGKSMTRHVSLPLAAVGAVAIKTSMDFHRSMGLVSQQAGASAGEVKKLEGRVLDLAKSSQFGPKELADALFHVESVGFRGAKAMEVLKSASDLATVGNSDLESTTYALVSAQKSGIKGTETLTKTIGTMNAIIGNGDMRMDQFTASLSSGLLVTGQQLGITLKDVGAALDVMTEKGIPAQAAATALNMGLKRMASLTPQGATALKSIGIDAHDLSKTMRTEGLLPAMKMLSEHLHTVGKDARTDILTAAFGAKSSKAILALVNDTGELDKKMRAITKGQGNFNEKLAEANKLAKVRIKKAWSDIQVSLVKLGDVLIPIVLPALVRLAHHVETIATWFSKLPKPVKQVTVEFGLLLIVAGPLLSMFGSMAIGMATLSGTFPALIAGTEGAGLAMVGLAAGPLAAVIIAVGALAFGMNKLGTHMKIPQGIAQAWTDSFNKLVPKFKDMSAAQRNWTIAGIQNAVAQGKMAKSTGDAWIASLQRIDAAQSKVASVPWTFGTKIAAQGRITLQSLVGLESGLKQMGPKMKVRGAETAVAIAVGLEKAGKIPLGVAMALRAQLEKDLGIRAIKVIDPAKLAMRKLQDQFDKLGSIKAPKFPGLDLKPLDDSIAKVKSGIKALGNIKNPNWNLDVGAKADTAGAKKAGAAVKKAASGKATVQVGVGGNATGQAKSTFQKVKGIVGRVIGFVFGFPNVSRPANKTWSTAFGILRRLITTPVKTQPANSPLSVYQAIKSVFSPITQLVKIVTQGSPRAKGDKDFHGGAAIVGEKGRELATLPNGTMTMLGKHGTQLTVLPKHTEILTNAETESLMRLGIPGFAKGTKKATKRLKAAINAAAGAIARSEEGVDIATRTAGFPNSEAGTEIGPGEKSNLISLNEALLALLKKQDKAVKKAKRKFRHADSTTKGSAKSLIQDIEGVTGRGGKIFDVKETLANLRFGTLDSGGGSSEDLVALLKEQLTQSQLAFGVSQAQFKVLKDLPAFGGSFAQGGIVPGPAGVPRTIIAHGGESVGQGGPLRIEVHGDIVSDHKNPIQAFLGSREFDVAVQKSNRKASKRGNRPLASGGRV